MIHNAANSHIAIATYNHRVLRFYTYEKDELRAYVVPDCERTYCPLPRNKLFLNVVERRQDIEKLIEKISIAINENHEKANIPGSISGSAIKAGIDALKGNGGRVMIFNCNSCVHGFGFCKPKDDSKLLGTEKEKILYHPQVMILM